MRTLGFAVAAVATLAMFGVSGASAADVSDATSIVDSLDVTSVGRLVAEIGGQKVETREEGEKKYVTFYDGEQPYIIAITLCDAKPGKCMALMQLALVDTGATKITSEQMDKLNGDSLFLTGFTLDGNKIGFGRILIVDGGVTRQNLAINIAGFVVTFQEEMKKLAGQLTSSLERSGNTAAAAAMANTHFRPVQADPRHIRYVSDQLLAQYRTMLTRGIRH